METTHVDGNRNNNDKIEDEFDNCTDDKVSIYETIISGGFINEELYDTHNKQRSIHAATDENINDRIIVGFIKEKSCNTEYNEGNIHNYVRIEDENIDDLNLVIPKTECKPDCTDDKICLNETVISRGYIKQETCGVKDEQGTIQNYLGIKEENIDDLTVAAQETESLTDCDYTDNKLCVYETIISGGYIKEEPCDIDIDMKGCEECGEKYDLYCLKCPMLIRIFNSNNPDGTDDTDRRTLPKNFIDICEIPSGVGIVALRTIPKGVVFGPFEGLDSSKDEALSKWKLKNRELAPTKDSEQLNWMQYIRRADKSSCQNLVPFQYKDELYYRSECQIDVGDELLVCWDSDSSEIQGMEDSYWEPRVCESLDGSYACTFCCVGYRLISHLRAHNSTCIAKSNKKDFCKGIVQCNICKIYLDEKEYSDYHMDRCYKSDEKCLFNSRCRRNRGRPVHNGYRPFSCTLCLYKTKYKSSLEQHIAIHNGEKPFTYTFCPYKTVRKSDLKKHIAIHNGDKPFACALCPYKTTTKSSLKQHSAFHNDDKPFACTFCLYKTQTRTNLKQHMATHNGDKPVACALCPYKTTTKYKLKDHIVIHNDDKPFACTFCLYKAKTKSSLKRHVANHNGDKPFACTFCPYKATTKSTLERHVVIHNDDKPFACTLCLYKTKAKSSLKKHVAYHNTDESFACTLCLYKTTRKACLKQHSVTHNGDKPFACTLCPYKTKTKTRLKRHTAAHNGRKPFVCNFCSYKTKIKSRLTKHIAIHNDDKP